MQFATLTASGARPVLIDAVEYSFLEQAVDIPDEPMDEAALEWKLAYGVFLPQPYKEPEVAAAKIRGHADLLPENWTGRSWKIPVTIPWGRNIAAHEEVEVFGGSDRLHPQAG